MTEIVNMELKKYPEDQDIDFYQRWITVKQGDNEHLINLSTFFARVNKKALIA